MKSWLWTMQNSTDKTENTECFVFRQDYNETWINQPRPTCQPFQVSMYVQYKLYWTAPRQKNSSFSPSQHQPYNWLATLLNQIFQDFFLLCMSTDHYKKDLSASKIVTKFSSLNLWTKLPYQYICLLQPKTFRIGLQFWNRTTFHY